MTINPHDLSIRQLEYVVAVAETLGFHKAAARCHVSQPTLSAQIKQLEDVLGIILFERDRRRVLVTSAGARLVAHARRVLVEIGDLLDVATELAAPGTATIAIGVIPTIAPYLLPEVMPRTRERFPRLKLVFREEKTEAILSDLEGGRLDAGIVALDPGLGRWASARVVVDDFLVAMPKSHPLAKKKQVTASDLDGERVLLLDDGHCFRSQVLALCQRTGAVESELRATSLATLVQMVSAGTGITLLPQLSLAVENRGKQLAIRPFAPSSAPHRTIGLIWRPASPLGETLRALAKTFAGRA